MKLTIRILLIAFLLSACSIKHQGVTSSTVIPLDIGDGGFLSQKPCGPPCFWGMAPDITTQEQAINILQQKVNIENCSSPWPVPSDESWIVCEPLALQIGVDGKIMTIGFAPNVSVTAAEVISKYGNPNAVALAGFSVEGANTPTTSVAASLLFDNIRVEVYFAEQEGSVYDIEPSTKITGVSYLGQERWEAATTVSTLHDWAGFGKYEGPHWAGP